MDLPHQHASLRRRHFYRGETEVGQHVLLADPDCVVVACSRLVAPKEMVLGIVIVMVFQINKKHFLSFPGRSPSSSDENVL